MVDLFMFWFGFSAMRRARARELPGYTSFDVPAKILKETMVEWPRLAKQYYEKAFSALNKIIKTIMERHFKRYANLHSAARYVSSL